MRIDVAHLGMAICLYFAIGISAEEPRAPPDAAEVETLSDYQTRTIEGWTVLVSERLLADEKTATRQAIDGLTRQLHQIVRSLPGAAVAHLRAVSLWISPEYPGVQPKAEYHPNADWLREHGRNPAMAKSVEFTNVLIFDGETRRMPVFVLHELAHAYHDQVLGFDNRTIAAVSRQAMAAKLYDAVRRNDGKTVRAYAATNAREYFAETTEAFFGRNDFYPFTREELKQHDPRMYDLLERIWLRGEVPGPDRGEMETDSDKINTPKGTEALFLCPGGPKGRVVTRLRATP
jgi:hypothetical protein